MWKPFSFLTVLVASAAATISETQYDQIYNIIRFAEVSYCMDNSSFSVGPFPQECAQNSLCRESPQVSIIKTITPDLEELELSGTAYVAVDESTSIVYVGFRGTETLGDWVTDLSFAKCTYAPYYNSSFSASQLAATKNDTTSQQKIMATGDTDSCPGDCEVHCGLYTAYSQFMDEIYDATLPYLENDYQLFLTGHSLGGGYAGLAGAEFQLQGFNPLLITYASLKQGNEAYNSFVDDLFGTVAKNESIAAGNAFTYGTYVRVFSVDDLVPFLPPGDDYTNGGLQFEITVSGVLGQTADEVDYLGPSDNSETTSLSWTILTDDVVDNHKDYFILMGEPCSSS